MEKITGVILLLIILIVGLGAGLFFLNGARVQCQGDLAVAKDTVDTTVKQRDDCKTEFDEKVLTTEKKSEEIGYANEAVKEQLAILNASTELLTDSVTTGFLGVAKMQQAKEIMKTADMQLKEEKYDEADANCKEAKTILKNGIKELNDGITGLAKLQIEKPYHTDLFAAARDAADTTDKICTGISDAAKAGKFANQGAKDKADLFIDKQQETLKGIMYDYDVALDELTP